jgi:hypothetical protein
MDPGGTILAGPDGPAGLASTFACFASDESSYVTSEMLGVTGGRPVS